MLATLLTAKRDGVLLSTREISRENKIERSIKWDSTYEECVQQILHDFALNEYICKHSEEQDKWEITKQGKFQLLKCRDTLETDIPIVVED